ncbi:MAG TPA: arginine decarboxylase, partial [Halomonas sp.]|nr:arginine decarboxylase [Halomonas sp.]
ASVGKGKWQNTGGEKSKFGLTASQILEVVETLRAQDALASLQLVHFHLGSQIANIRDIQRGLRECARFYQNLMSLGA